jgi:RecA-family ATPase
MPYSSVHSKDNDLYTVSDLISWTPPSVIRIIDKGIFNVCNRMLIFGDEGSWKSMLTIHTAVCLSNGSDWFGFKTTKCNLLKIQVELPMYSDRERTEKYSKGHELILTTKIMKNYTTPESQLEAKKWIHSQAYPSNLVSKTATFYHIDESFAYENMKKAIDICLTELPPNRPLVVILDPLYMLVGGNPNDGAEMKKLLTNIDLAMSHYAAKGFFISFILIHHMKKPDTDSNGQAVNGGSNDQSGTRDFQKWADTVIRLDLDQNNSKRVKFRFTKHRNAEDDMPDLELKWDRETLHPQVTARYLRHDPKDDEEEILRGSDKYLLLEG